MTSRVSTSPDTTRMGAAVGYPGIDPRVWVSLAVVVGDVVVDPEEGAFVDVTLLPSGQAETARLGADYAGAGFGFYAPPAGGDEVLVCAPSGDPNEGLVVTRRLWSPADPPPPDAADHPADVVLHVREGQTVRVVTGGAGDVVLDARGSGSVRLGSESAPYRALRGELFEALYNALVDAFLGHYHFDSNGGTTSGPLSGPTTPNPGFIGPPALPSWPGNPPLLAGASGAAQAGEDEMSPNVRVK